MVCGVLNVPISSPARRVPSPGAIRNASQCSSSSSVSVKGRLGQAACAMKLLCSAQAGILNQQYVIPRTTAYIVKISPVVRFAKERGFVV